MEKIKYVIFAPHIDDEMIGCFSYINERKISDVYYFYDLTSERIAEAINVSLTFGFNAHIVKDISEIKLDDSTVILAPSSFDLHMHHKEVNRIAKTRFKNKKLYYSVDMNRKPKVLSTEDIKFKKYILEQYQSQSVLLSDEKYHLFEDIHSDDSEKFIWVTFQKKGFHKYPEASTSKELQDVSYLGYEHRHMFKFKVSIEVNHDNREIEFHQFLNWVESLYEGTLQLDYKSCEMIADDLAIEIGKMYQDRKLIIEVSEDGECGCTCNYKI